MKINVENRPKPLEFKRAFFNINIHVCIIPITLDIIKKTLFYIQQKPFQTTNYIICTYQGCQTFDLIFFDGSENKNLLYYIYFDILLRKYHGINITHHYTHAHGNNGYINMRNIEQY